MITPEQIKAARIAAGLTQEQAAAVVGFTRNGWQKAEYGEKKMRPAIFELFKLKTEKKERKMGNLFREDNTTGYSKKELDALNKEWEEKSQDLDPDSDEYKNAAKAFSDEVAGR